MAETSIEWTQGPRGEPGYSFNPWWICTEISDACTNCYARTFAHRLGYAWGPDAPRRFFGDHHWAQPLKWNAKARLRGERYRVFCASMADVFDNDPTVEPHRQRLWELIRQTPNLDWLLLTKRIGNAQRMLPADWGNGYANVWLGATIANQEEADRDIGKLLSVPARIRFLSCEPLLGQIDLQLFRRSYGFPKHITADGRAIGMPQGLHWVIGGGESGPKARPTNVQWARSLRDQCVAAGVSYFWKQWGAWLPGDQTEARGFGCDQISTYEWGDAEDSFSIRLKKKDAGRMLDGRTWDQSPGHLK